MGAAIHTWRYCTLPTGNQLSLDFPVRYLSHVKMSPAILYGRCLFLVGLGNVFARGCHRPTKPIHETRAVGPEEGQCSGEKHGSPRRRIREGIGPSTFKRRPFVREFTISPN